DGSERGERFVDGDFKPFAPEITLVLREKKKRLRSFDGAIEAEFDRGLTHRRRSAERHCCREHERGCLASHERCKKVDAVAQLPYSKHVPAPCVGPIT